MGMTDHRLSDELLAAYVAGSASQGVSLVVAAHLTYCHESRAKVEALEVLAGAMLTEAPNDTAAPSFDDLLRSA